MNEASEILNATSDQLKAKAEELGLEFSSRAKLGALRTLVADALGIVIEQEEKAAPKEITEIEGRIWVRIQPDTRDGQPVPITHNGDTITIKRGEWVHIPKRYARILEDAVRYEMNPKTFTMEAVQSYPHDIRTEKPNEHRIQRVS